MVDNGVVISYEISKLLEERAVLRQELDRAQSQFAEMEKLALQVASSMPAQIPQELTRAKTPPAEIAAALQYFQSELARMNKAQEEIKVYQAEINELEYKQRRNVVIIGILLGIVLLVISFGTDLITLIMPNISP